MLKTVNKEIRSIQHELKSLDKKTIIVFLSVAILQTISWYYTSRQFFRDNIYNSFSGYKYIDLMEFLFWFATDFITLLIIPLLIIRIVFKERLRDFGFRVGNYKYGLSAAGISLIFILLILWYISNDPEFLSDYPLLESAGENWTIFIIYEAGLLLYLFAWEYIWRGFMLFGLEKRFGLYSIFIQMIPFVILHNGKPALETFGAIIGAILLGILALRTRSFIYGVIIHFFVIFGIDLISVIHTKFYLSSKFF